ncbi:TPA: secretion protein EspF, partial [Escherichia coli]|nr:secretion protein EspF [Escherichia coli]
MLNGISNAVSTIGRHLRGVASRVGSAGVSGFSVAPQTVRLTPVRFHSPFSPGSSNINARTTFNMSHMSHMSHMSQMSQMSQMSRMSQMATSFTPTRPAPPPPTSGQASGSAGLPPIAQALKDHLAAYELSKASETVSFKPTRQA